MRNSWNHYDRIVRSEDAKEAGMSVLSGYHIFDGNNSYKAVSRLKSSVYNIKLVHRHDVGLFG